MKNLILLLTLLSLLTVFAGCSESPVEKQQRLMGEAIDAVNHYKFDAARDALGRLDELTPNSPFPLFGQGLVYERMLYHYDALGTYVGLTNLYPSFPEAHAGAWRIFTRLDMHLEALSEANEYRKLLPQDGESALVMAVALINSGLPNRAHALLDTAVTQGVDRAQAAMIHARAYIAEDKPNDADSAYEAGLAGAGASAPVFADAVLYLERAGLIDSAMVMSRKVMALAKEDMLAAQRHLELAVRHRYFAEADDILKRFRALGLSDVVVYMNEALRYDAAGMLAPARDGIDRAAALTGSTLSTRMLDSEIRMRTADQMTLTTNQDVIVAQLNDMGYDEEFQGIMLYQLALQMGRLLPGLQAFGPIDRLRPIFRNKAEIVGLRLLSLYVSGQSAEFERGAAELISQHGGQVEWMAALGDVYDQVRIYEEKRADETFRRVLELDPWRVSSFTTWVNMYRKLHRPADAAKLFDAYPHFAERFPNLAMLEGICLVEAGDGERGTAVFLMNAPYNRGDELRHDEFLRALRDRWHLAGLDQYATWLRENGAGNPYLLNLAASIQLDLGKAQEGLALADGALKISPSLVDARTSRARALYALGEVEQAIAILKSNLDSMGYNVGSNYWLSRILATEGRDPLEAQNYARRAVMDAQSRLAEWLNLMYVYQQTGRYDLARGEALKATRSYSTEPGPFFRLGVALYLENKPDEARQRLEEALERGLVGDDLSEARDLLAKLKS